MVPSFSGGVEGEGSSGELGAPACGVWSKGFPSNHNRIDGGGVSRDHWGQPARPSEGRMIQVCVEQALQGGEEGGVWEVWFLSNSGLCLSGPIFSGILAGPPPLPKPSPTPGPGPPQSWAPRPLLVSGARLSLVELCGGDRAEGLREGDQLVCSLQGLRLGTERSGCAGRKREGVGLGSPGLGSGRGGRRGERLSGMENNHRL